MNSIGATRKGSEDGRVTTSQSVKRMAERALARRLEKINDIVLDSTKRAARLNDVMVDGMPSAVIDAVLSDIRQGDGAELKPRGQLLPKFHSAYSSAGLAVNVFGRWRLSPQTLVLEKVTGFTGLRFEAKLPIFAKPVGAPNLDLLLRREELCQYAIESKCTEYLAPKAAAFSKSYGPVYASAAHPSWRALYTKLCAKPSAYLLLDAAQLLKHYLGLKKERSAYVRGAARSTLLYLFWEPEDADRWPVFSDHRQEIASFARDLDDPDVRFQWLSYRELWGVWFASGDEELRSHVMKLRHRYGVTLDEVDRIPQGEESDQKR
jgi:hypothetical protein